MFRRQLDTRVMQNKHLILASLLFLRCPSHVNLFGLLPFAPENSRIFQGDVVPQLTLADICFAFGIIQVGQLENDRNKILDF